MEEEWKRMMGRHSFDTFMLQSYSMIFSKISFEKLLFVVT